MRKPHLSLLVSCLALALAGCSSDALTSTTIPSASAAPTELVRQINSWNWGSGQQTLGLFNVHLNPDTLQCDIAPITTRHGAQQGEYFDMDLGDFLIETGRSASLPAMFAVESVSLDEDLDAEVHFTHAHPFDAPNPFADPIATNRADLAYTGRAVMLADLNGLTDADFTFAFTAGTKIANTEALKAPDGYLSPTDTNGGESLIRSLHDPGGEDEPDYLLETDTFPYVLLADEVKDNRFIGECAITNGGLPTGNYGKDWDGSALTGGWQLGNMYPPSNLALNETQFNALNERLLSWTGFDYVHHGQSIRNTMVIQREYLLEHDLNFLVAVVIKYTDPVNGADTTERRSHWLPLAPVDVSGFAYRLPHAALDYSVITVEGTGADVGDPIPVDQADATTTVDLFVRDWDVEADTEDDQGDDDDVLDDESDVSLVFEGANGYAGGGEVRSPHFVSHADCIAVTGTSGHPGDELPYTVTIEDDDVTGLDPGDYQVMVRFEDPEQNSDDSQAAHLGFEPNQNVNWKMEEAPVPSTQFALDAVTYQAFTIRISDPCPVINSVGHNGSTPPVPGDTVVWTATTTPSSPDTGTYWDYSWTFGHGATPDTASGANAVVMLDSPGIHTVRLVITVREIVGDVFVCQTSPYEDLYEVGCYATPAWNQSLLLDDCGTGGLSVGQRTSMALLPSWVGSGQGGMAAVVFNDHRTTASCTPADHFDLSLVLVNPTTGALVAPPSPGNTVFGLDGHPNPSMAGTDPRDTPISVGDTSLVVTEAGIAVVYLATTASPATNELRMTFSAFPLDAVDPSDSSDNGGWAPPIFVDDAVNNTYNSAISRCDGASIAISYQGLNQNALVAEGPIMDQSPTFTVFTVEADGDVGDQSSLLEYRGRLALTYASSSAGSVRFARALSPDVGSPWASPMEVFSGGAATGDTALVELGGRLVVGFRTSSGGTDPQDVTLAFAEIQEPASGTDWTVFSSPIEQGAGTGASTGVGFELKALVADGRLALAYRDGENAVIRMARACVAFPTSSADFELVTASNPFFDSGVDLGFASNGVNRFYIANGGPDFFTGEPELQFFFHSTNW